MKTLLLASTILFFMMHNVSLAQKTQKATTTQPKKIYQVKSVELILDRNRDELTVRATGETTTPGWTNATLKPTFSVVKSDDGVYRFDFVAVPPHSAEKVAQVTTPVSAEYVFKSIPVNLKSVIVNAEDNKIEKKYSVTPPPDQLSHINMSCDETKPGTLVFNTGGSYRIVLQRLEMGTREDAGLCISGTENCWEHLQLFSEGSAIVIKDVAPGSALQVQSSQKKGAAPLAIYMNDISCPPKEGFVYFEDAKGFKMQLKIEQISEQLTLNRVE